MPGIIDWLSGAPNLSQLTSLGVDPSTVQAFQTIQNQAQSAAIGPALMGGVLSALAGPRRGAGVRALAGAGRAYTSAEQRAQQLPIQLATFANQQKLAQLKLQEGVVGMQQKQQSIEYMQKREAYLDYLKKKPGNVMDKQLGMDQLKPLLTSPSPAVQQMAQSFQHDLENGNLNATQFHEALQGAETYDRFARSGQHVSIHTDPNTGKAFIVATDRYGNLIAQHAFNPPGSAGKTPGLTPEGGYDWSQQPKGVEQKVMQDYNKYHQDYWKNIQNQANIKGARELKAGGHIPATGAPLSFEDWLASKGGEGSVVAHGGHPVSAYKQFHTPIGAVVAEIPPGNRALKAKPGDIFWLASKGMWVKRVGKNLVRANQPFIPGKTIGTSAAGADPAGLDTGTSGATTTPAPGARDTGGANPGNAVTDEDIPGVDEGTAIDDGTMGGQ